MESETHIVSLLCSWNAGQHVAPAAAGFVTLRQFALRDEEAPRPGVPVRRVYLDFV